MKYVFVLLKHTGYPGMPNIVNSGKPGDPPGTQWQTPDISPQRLKDGRHLLYMDATTKGMSGSPLYILKVEKSAVFFIPSSVGFLSIASPTNISWLNRYMLI